MHICLLTRFLSQTSSSRFMQRVTEEARALGHQFSLLNPAYVQVDFEDHAMPLKYEEKEFPPFDMIHFAVRWNDEHSWQIIDVLNLWQQKVFPSARLPLGDRVTLARLFAKEGVVIPKSWTVERMEQLELIVTDMTYPVLFKARLPQGGGRQVLAVQDEGTLRQHASEALKGAGSFLLQEILAKTEQDLVAFVVGDVCVAAVERKLQDGKVITEPVDLMDEEYKLALAAKQIYDAPYAAVNFVRTASGPVFMELSRIPMLTDAEEVTQVNIAKEIVQHCVASASVPAGAVSAGNKLDLVG